MNGYVFYKAQASVSAVLLNSEARSDAENSLKRLFEGYAKRDGYEPVTEFFINYNPTESPGVLKAVGFAVCSIPADQAAKPMREPSWPEVRAVFAPDFNGPELGMKLCCRNELIKAAEDLMDRHRESYSDEVNLELDQMAVWLRRRADQ